MKKHKVLDINACGVSLKGYYEEGKRNPWRLYKIWWDQGEHRKLLVEYANFISVSMYIDQLFRDTPDAWRD